MKGQGRGNGQGRGAGGGQGGGGRGQSGAAMGAGGSCLCPKCGRRFPHQPGAPCLEERCEECGVALVREGSPHHQQILQRRENAAASKTEG